MPYLLPIKYENTILLRSIVSEVFFISASSPHPTMVPIPTSLSTPTPATEVNSSGAEDPAAMKVAPATSSLKSSFSEIASREGTKKSSQMIAIAASERRR